MKEEVEEEEEEEGVSCRVVSFRPPSVPAAAAGLCDAVSTWGSSPSRSTMGISASSLLDETKSKNVKGNEPRDSVHRKLRVVLWRRVLAAIVESMKKPHVFLGASPESEKSEPVHQTGVSKLKKKNPNQFHLKNADLTRTCCHTSGFLPWNLLGVTHRLAHFADSLERHSERKRVSDAVSGHSRLERAETHLSPFCPAAGCVLADRTKDAS